MEQIQRNVLLKHRAVILDYDIAILISGIQPGYGISQKLFKNQFFREL
jgi:hypothetical protein